MLVVLFVAGHLQAGQLCPPDCVLCTAQPVSCCGTAAMEPAASDHHQARHDQECGHGNTCLNTMADSPRALQDAAVPTGSHHTAVIPERNALLSATPYVATGPAPQYAPPPLLPTRPLYTIHCVFLI